MNKKIEKSKKMTLEEAIENSQIMKNLKTWSIWDGTRYGQYASFHLFVEWKKGESDCSIWEIGEYHPCLEVEGCATSKRVSFDIKHIDKIIKALKEIKREYKNETKNK